MVTMCMCMLLPQFFAHGSCMSPASQLHDLSAVEILIMHEKLRPHMAARF